MPIYGLMVPFHILAVKNAVNSQEGDHSYIRINFNFGPTYEPGAKFPQAIFLKELSYRTSDNRHAAKVCPLCPLCPLPAHCLSFVTWRGFLYLCCTPSVQQAWTEEGSMGEVHMPCRRRKTMYQACTHLSFSGLIFPMIFKSSRGSTTLV